ncbi:uncharacterized protein LOC111259778 isoform X2 [Varroa jacobsoni]|uniref:Uncharacterized protein n=1 Tax=Varroa destructor TaxID=109461 RepID=A0A7M7MBG6_VARDE|nr:uncharacterized protein LOC111245569 isoform X3 [Varroa destructor]XP_022687853.1 uncharacterized protein LOC111259778 isoform X2 [Varroa jacobsoni]
MVVAALSDRWRKLMSQLTIDTSSNSKISLNTREELREALHNESTRSYASTFDITDDIGVLEDSVFETGNLAPGISGSGLFPAQLRKMVLRTLFIMVAAYLTVLVLMVGVAILVDEVRYYLTTYRTIAYLLFLLLPLVHCIWMLRSPARSTFVLPLFVIILGYVESVLSCVYNTYCIFITNEQIPSRRADATG